MCRFAAMLGETKGESFQLSPAHLLLCTGRKECFSPCRIFAILMNSHMEMVNNVLVAGAIEICIILTIIGEDFP